jgi:hypothetical protein
VGRIVLDAVRGNVLYAPTHAEWLPQVAERHARIQAGFPALQVAYRRAPEGPIHGGKNLD